MSATSNVKKCVEGLTFHPRWDKSRKGSDRIEFEIFENIDKIPYPKMKDVANAKQGRKRFVTKDNNGNGNSGNGNNRKGHIVSFIPSNTFVTNMEDLTTSNFRALQFDGIMMFEELTGCFGVAYWVNKGVVMKRLEIQTISSVTPRCGYASVEVDWWQQVYSGGLPVGEPTYLGSGTQYTYTGCLEISNGIMSYDATMAANQSISGNPANTGDTYYNDYLTPNSIKGKDRICPISFTYQQVGDPTNQATRLEAGLRDGGVTFNTPGGGTVSFQFSYVTFGIPFISPAYPNGISTAEAARITANASNLALNQVQQRVMTGEVINNLGNTFWNTIDFNLQSILRIPLSNVGPEKFHTLGTGVLFYYRNDGSKQTIVYNQATTGC